MERYFIIGLSAFIVFLLVTHLDDHQLEYYDEGRRAVSASEMVRGESSPFIPTYAGESDHFESKPPLHIWTQAFWIAVLGPTLVAVRLPAVLASLGLLALLWWWAKREWGRPLIGVVAALGMFLSYDWMGTHGARSGDHDAPLVFFLTAQVVAVHQWVRYGKSKYAWLLALSVLLAGMTKGVAGGFLLPGIGLWLLTSREGRAKLLRWELYVGVGAAILAVVAYYVLRDAVDPGYLEIIRHNELDGRLKGYGDTEFEPPWYYYIGRMVNDGGFGIYALLFPLATAVAFLRSPRLHPARLCALVVLPIFLVLSASTVKMYWYKAPIMPFVALVSAGFMVAVLDEVGRDWRYGRWMAVGVAATLFILPLYAIVERVTQPSRYRMTSVEATRFRPFLRNEEVRPPYTIMAVTYNPNARWLYEQALHTGQDVKLKNSRDELLPLARGARTPVLPLEVGERIVICHQETWDFVSERALVVDIFAEHPCKLVRVDSIY